MPRRPTAFCEYCGRRHDRNTHKVRCSHGCYRFVRGPGTEGYACHHHGCCLHLEKCDVAPNVCCKHDYKFY